MTYDAIYRASPEYRKPYRESFYYRLWQQAVTLLPEDRDARILELGCGTGQFAAMLHDLGYRRYTGVDISPVAVSMAKTPGVVVGDAFKYLAHHDDYDVVIALETFEHLDDRALLGLVKPGATVIFSVPNFANSGHLRYFATANQVRRHYGSLVTFSYLSRDMKDRGQCWYLARVERKRPTVLAIMPAYNEIDYLPLKLAWCRRHGLKMYVIDNYSTDGTWEWLQQNHIRSHRVDTGGAFDLVKIQAEVLRIVRALKPDWAIYQGVDLFFETDRPIVHAISMADAQGYNLLEMRVIGLFNTGEPRDRFDPFNTYYGMGKGRKVALIHKVCDLAGYHGDAVDMTERRVKRIPGIVANMGMTKPAAAREDTFRRRELAWKRGLRQGYGKHYEDGRAQGWVWQGMTDIRKTGYWYFYQKLGTL